MRQRVRGDIAPERSGDPHALGEATSFRSIKQSGLGSMVMRQRVRGSIAQQAIDIKGTLGTQQAGQSIVPQDIAQGQRLTVSCTQGPIMRTP